MGIYLLRAITPSKSARNGTCFYAAEYSYSLFVWCFRVCVVGYIAEIQGISPI